MKNNSRKLLAVTSAVITALSVYSQSAIAIDLTNPTVGMSIAGGEHSLAWGINADKEDGVTATVGLIVKENSEGGANVITAPSSSLTITARGDKDIQGVLVYGQSSLDLGTSSIVNSDGGGVFITDSSTFTANKLAIHGGSASESPMNGDPFDRAVNSSGLGISGSSKVNLGQDSKITIAGNDAYGVFVDKSSELIADGLTINVTGETTKFSYDVLAGLRSRSSNVSLGTNSQIITNGVSGVIVENSNGLATKPTNLESTDGLYIETTGNMLTGLQINAGSTVKLSGTSTIKAIGLGATAVVVYSDNSTNGDTLFEADTLKLSATEGTALSVMSYAKQATVTIGAGSTLESSERGHTMVVSGIGATINYNGTADNRNTILSNSVSNNSNTIGAGAMDGTINLKFTDITVRSNSLYGYGIEAAENSVINADNITVTVENTTHPTYGIRAQASSEIHLTGDTVINAKGGTAILSKLASSFAQGYRETGGIITGDGKMTITGDILVNGSDALIDLKMQPDSLFTGKSSIDPTNNGTLNLALTDSKWDMTQDSEATNLIVNNSTVTFSEQKVGSTLTVGNLSGNGGIFDMMVDIPNLKSDLLVVTGTSSGAHHIRATNQGSAVTNGSEIIPMVHTADGVATFDLPTQVELGGYVYRLRRGVADNTAWELYSYVPDPIVPIDPNDPVAPFTPSASVNPKNISTTADASANFLNSSYLMNYAETQTLLQRMGELRQAENSQGDAWVRAYSGKFDSFGSGKLSDFDMSYTGVQVGADKRLSVEGGDVYVGGMVGFAEADPKFVSGDGSLKSYNLGIYATYVAENDFYIDGVLKYTHMKNSFNNVKDTQGNITSGDTSSDGYGISLEAGKRFYLQQPKSGYYIEPQAQITFSHQGGSSTTASNGLVTSIDSYDSTLGRLSALVGYEMKDGANPMNVYFKTGVVTEMSGNTNYALNGSKESNDFGGSWWENGIGLTAQINKAHNLYVEGTYSTGSKFDQMQINAGYRYNF